jgi:hypothetical protein
MRTHRFGRKLKLPATLAIKHQLRKLMFEDAVKKAEAGARAEAFADNCAKKHDRSCSRAETYLQGDQGSVPTV